MTEISIESTKEDHILPSLGAEGPHQEEVTLELSLKERVRISQVNGR